MPVECSFTERERKVCVVVYCVPSFLLEDLSNRENHISTSTIFPYVCTTCPQLYTISLRSDLHCNPCLLSNVNAAAALTLGVE